MAIKIKYSKILKKIWNDLKICRQTLWDPLDKPCKFQSDPTSSFGVTLL